MVKIGISSDERQRIEFLSHFPDQFANYEDFRVYPDGVVAYLTLDEHESNGNLYYVQIIPTQTTTPPQKLFRIILMAASDQDVKRWVAERHKEKKGDTKMWSGIKIRRIVGYQLEKIPDLTP
jgi:hypothetical protein